MPAEGRLRLTSPPTFHLPDLSDVAPGLLASPPDEQRIETTYFDTPDLRLARAGVTLADRHGQGWVLQLPPGRSEGERRELRFEGRSGVVPAEAVRLVAAFRLAAELRPVGRLSTLRRRVGLRDKSGADVVEVLDEELSVLDGRRVAARFRQVEVVPAAGVDAETVDRIRARLVEAGAGDDEPAPELVRALGPGVERPADVSPAELRPDATVADAIRAALARPAESLLRNDWALRRGEETDAVRRVRVATRRLRSRLGTFADFLDPEWAHDLAEDLGWLADALAAVRDQDVRAARVTAQAPRLEPGDRRVALDLAGRATAAAAAARSGLGPVLDSPRYLALLDRVAGAATAPPLTGDHERPAAEVLRELPRRRWKRLRREVRGLDAEPSEAALHDVRIRAKQARYAAEAAVPFEPAAAEFAAALEAVQGALGEHHDSAATRAWLREVAGAGRRAFVAGQLHALEAEAGARSLEEFRQAWRAARRPRLRKWMA